MTKAIAIGLVVTVVICIILAFAPVGRVVQGLGILIFIPCFIFGVRIILEGLIEKGIIFLIISVFALALLWGFGSIVDNTSYLKRLKNLDLDEDVTEIKPTKSKDKKQNITHYENSSSLKEEDMDNEEQEESNEFKGLKKIDY